MGIILSKKQKSELFDALSKADSVEKVEGIFSKYNITNFLEKANLLLEFQGELSHASSDFATLPHEEIYRFELAIFLKGAWKKAKVYTYDKTIDS